MKEFFHSWVFKVLLALCIVMFAFLLRATMTMGASTAIKPRRRYVPTSGACRLPGYFQGNLVPPIREQGSKTLPRVYAVPCQEQPRAVSYTHLDVYKRQT